MYDLNFFIDVIIISLCPFGASLMFCVKFARFFLNFWAVVAMIGVCVFNNRD